MGESGIGQTTAAIYNSATASLSAGKVGNAGVSYINVVVK